ncbi:RNA-binding protein [Cupriavidus basilensis]|uniref:RNA-binding protein n=1 Tax=Cupriavidus basilensis TaxID=68895 RepID=UPI00157BB081|nr:RNA-binding protein [Cupriavidus basilensis]NUA30441.1 RNA-binding protein [Cupriavidus basilensis]
MKVLVRGLRAEVDASALRTALAAYVRVKDIELIREGDCAHPWAWVDLDLDDVDPMSVWKLVAKLDRRYIAGCHTRWHVPAYRAR